MGVRHATYLDMPPDQRRKAANEAKARIQSYLVHPILSDEQRAKLHEDLARLNQWEAGTLPVHREPQQHSVNLSEAAVELKESLS